MKTKTLLLTSFFLSTGLLTPSLYSQNFTFTTIAGGSPGFLNSNNTNAQFLNPTSLTVDGHGNIYVADQGNNAIREITPLGTNWIVSTIAGGVQGSLDGSNTAAQFYQPTGITMDSSGNLYVTDQYNSTIRKIVPVGANWVVSRIAGSVGLQGNADGVNANARFSAPFGIAVDNTGNLFVADEVNNAIRKITPSGANWIVTTIAGGSTGHNDGTNGTAQFSGPTGVAVDSSGRLYVADQFNNIMRLITPVGTNWVVTTIAGQSVSGRADGNGTNALFNAPVGVTVDNANNVYVADLFNSAIRKLTLAGSTWSVTTIGGGSGGTANGTGANAQFNLPFGVAADAFGDVFVADSGNNSIRLGAAAGSAAPTGNLQTTLTPASAISSGAEWQLDGGTLKTNGAILSALTPGLHTLSFRTISGFTTPAVQTIAVTAHQTAIATGNYAAAIANAGSLQVNLSPVAAVDAAAQWQVDGGAFHTNGAIAAGLTTGSHTVAFNAVAGWTTPVSQSVTITNSQTTLIQGTYVLQTGSIQVTLLPTAVVTAGAKWQVDGGPFQLSGAALTGLLPGSHTITFNTVLGWIAPPSQIATVINNVTASTSANYSRPVSYQVQLGGMAAVSGGFQFTLTGPAGSNCVIQVSSDLRNWSPLSTNTIAASGTLVFSDSGAASQRLRFYRAKLP